MPDGRPQFSFTDFQVHHPQAPPPGDKLDSEISRLDRVAAEISSLAAKSLNSDGSLRPAIVGKTQLIPGLFDDIVATAASRVEGLVDKALAASTQAGASASGASAAAVSAASDNDLAQAAAASAATDARLAAGSAAAAAVLAIEIDALAIDADNAAKDTAGDVATCQAYADVTYAWAEHMPDPIPPNILAVMGITGDHWSSRWWANQAAEIFDANHVGPPGPTGPPGATGPAAGGFPTKAAAQASTNLGSIPLGQTILVAGGQYQKVTAGPSSLVVFQSGDGSWWQLISQVINPRMVGAVGNGATDDTAIIQALANYCAANYGYLELDITGNFAVTTLKFQNLRIGGSGTLTAISATALPCVVQWAGNCANTGSLLIQGNYQATPYTCACLVGNGSSPSQFNYLANIFVNAFQLAWQFCTLANPSALVSENTIVGGGTYGCPQVCLAIGVETFVSVIGAQWAINDFGGNAAWQALPKNGITAVGGTVVMEGGELQGSSTTPMVLVRIQPLAGDVGTVYGRVVLQGVVGDVPGQYCVTSNPSSLTVGGSKVGGLTAIGSLGACMIDSGPWIELDASFVGDVIVEACTWQSVPVRTSANVLAHGAGARITLDGAGFGPNFLPSGVTVPSPITIPNGGTSATTAAAALTNLGAAPIASPTFTGAVSAQAYQTRTGTAGPYTGHYFNIDWTGAVANLWIDAVNQGPVTTGGPYLALAGGTLTGAVTPSQTAGIVGTTTNNNVNAGGVGESVVSQVLSAAGVAMTTGAARNITTIALTAGDWDIGGNVTYQPSTTITWAAASVNTTTAAHPDASLTGYTGPNGGSNVTFTAIAPRYRLSLSAPATVYLVGTATFTGTCTGSGYLWARRRR